MHPRSPHCLLCSFLVAAVTDSHKPKSTNTFSYCSGGWMSKRKVSRGPRSPEGSWEKASLLLSGSWWWLVILGIPWTCNPSTILCLHLHRAFFLLRMFMPVYPTLSLFSFIDINHRIKCPPYGRVSLSSLDYISKAISKQGHVHRYQVRARTYLLQGHVQTSTFARGQCDGFAHRGKLSEQI